MGCRSPNCCRERGAILDAFCMVTGYHRKYAMAMLRGHGGWGPPPGGTSPPLRSGVPAGAPGGLGASRYVCSERLHPFLSELVPCVSTAARQAMGGPLSRCHQLDWWSDQTGPGQRGGAGKRFLLRGSTAPWPSRMSVSSLTPCGAGGRCC